MYKRRIGMATLVAAAAFISISMGAVQSSAETGRAARCGAHGSHPVDQTVFPNGIASGDTTQTTTVLWARSAFCGIVRFEVSQYADFRHLEARRVAWVSNILRPVKVRIGGLEPGTAYHYRATAYYFRAHRVAHASLTGRFVTAHEPGDYSGLRFGVSGDWRGELSPYPAIGNVAGRALDFFVEHGDTVYADRRSPALDKDEAETLNDFRIKHAEVYGTRFDTSSWADVRASTTVLATIDDHEVNNDFAGGAEPASDPRFAGDPAALINDTRLYENGMRAFQEYNPLRNEFYGDTGSERTAFERKLYRYNGYGSDAAVMVLDARSFRDQALPEVENPFDQAEVIAFLNDSFDPDRTMLGQVQLDELMDDLLEAQDSGITWKFVLMPEPIQNLGVAAAADRYEGYAAERTRLLRFIDLNGIENVVFIAADLHGTLVNNLTYQDFPFGPQIPTTAFEIITGAVAFDAPFGPSVVELAASLGLLSPADEAFYNAAPRSLKDQFVEGLVNSQIIPLGYDPLGLDQNLPIVDGIPSADSLIDATLLEGNYTAVHTYGWTEFEIDPDYQTLTVTTYGIDAYSEEELLADPTAVLARSPEVISRFEVTPAHPALAAMANRAP